MKKVTLLIILVVLLTSVFMSCMTIQAAKLLLHEGIVQSYKLHGLDDMDLIVFTDNTSYCYGGIYVWNGCEASRNQCAVIIGQSYKIYHMNDNIAYLVPSNILDPLPTNCRCE